MSSTLKLRASSMKYCCSSLLLRVFFFLIRKVAALYVHEKVHTNATIFREGAQGDNIALCALICDEAEKDPIEHCNAVKKNEGKCWIGSVDPDYGEGVERNADTLVDVFVNEGEAVVI